MKISIICAMDEKRGIGKNNHLLFHIPEDFVRMKKLTSGHPIIMGRKTFESKEINKKPLPNRTNIVITHDPSYEVGGPMICNSLNEAIEIASKKDQEKIFIFGGGQIYEQALPVVDKLYLTIIDGEYDADTFFPDYSAFKKVILEEKHESDGYTYAFFELER